MSDRKNEGEGNRTAARAYDKATKAFARSGRVEKGAEEARRALEGDERAELQRAEQAGAARAKDEDPAVARRKPGGSDERKP